ncbi:hypothetical protein KQX54_011654 [Cotesia glomerata]|uniref:DUF4806 domain-containing protein n=1 Tax=Cotesia glomerata TaxID=32391 RepID=A0AAV7IHN1_COTGL|nr:hypothetical protein KQX54_011654 [Cotesia glomerata]
MLTHEESLYAVVHFLNDNSYSEIPTNWLLVDGQSDDYLSQCRWPSSIGQLNFRLKNRIAPCDDWPIYDIKIISFHAAPIPKWNTSFLPPTTHLTSKSGELRDNTLENSSRITVNSSKKDSISPRNDDNYEEDCFEILDIKLKDIDQLLSADNRPSSYSSENKTLKKVKKALPLKNKDDITQFETDLEKFTDFRREFVKIVSQVGGANGKEFNERLLNVLFSQSFAQHNTWEGKKKTNTRLLI